MEECNKFRMDSLHFVVEKKEQSCELKVRGEMAGAGGGFRRELK